MVQKRTLRDEKVHIPLIPVSMLVVYRHDGSIEVAEVHIPVIPVSMLVVYRHDGSIEVAEG